MAPILVVIILEALFSFVFRDMFPNGEVYVGFMVVLNSGLFLLYLARRADTSQLFLVFVLAFLFRLVLMVIDLEVARLLPHSGDDTEAFHTEALNIYMDPTYFSEALRGVYSKFLGIFYLLFGPERMLAQFLNVILGVISVVIFSKTLILLGTSEKVTFQSTVIFAFFVQGLLLSPILLRDQLVVLGMTYTVYYMVRWVDVRSFSSLICAYLSYLVSTVFHSGLAVGIGVLILFFSFYSHERAKMHFDPYKVQRMIVQFLVIGFVVFSFQDVLLAKFTHVTENELLFSGMSYDRGGSAYLNGLTVAGPLDMILYSPLRTVYFLFSPFPWQWTSVINIGIFAVDALPYLALSALILFQFRSLREHPYASVLLWILVLFIVNAAIFGLGTGNVGTAIRHRYKIFPLLLVVYTSIHYIRYHALTLKEVEQRAE